MFPNKYPGKCNNPACKVFVSENSGLTQKINGRYVVWCKKCVPERIEAVRRVLTSDGKIITPYEAQNKDLIKSLPGAHYEGDGTWSISLKMADRRRILEVADKIGLEVAPSLRVIETTEQAQNAMSAGLYPFQVEGVNFLAHKEKAILGDDMGLGKTVQSLMGIPVKNGCALVLCRAGLKYNWFDEVNKWRPDLKPVVLKKKSEFRWPVSGEVVIGNSESLPDEFNTPKKNKGEIIQKYWDRLYEYRESLKNKHPQASTVHLIVDEAHDYKNRAAAKTRKVKEFVKLVKKVTGLTGSPLNNRPEDLFGVLDVLGLAKEAFPPIPSRNLDSWGRFLELFDAHKNRFGGIDWGKPQPIVPELLRRVMLRRRRADVLPDLPNKTYTNMLVGVDDPELLEALDNLWEEWEGFITLKGELPPFEMFSEIRQKLARSRVATVLDYVENAEEQEVPLVVFSAHLAPLDALLGRPGWAVITGVTSPEKRQEIVRAFQAGKLKGVGVSIKAGGVGINLTRAWKALFVDLEWAPAANWQAEDRLCRIGQKANKVEIVRMVSNHPLDIHIHNMLVDKIDTIIKAIDSTIFGETVKVPQGETEEQFQERMRKVIEQTIQTEKNVCRLREVNQKAYAKGKVNGIYNREKARLKSRVLPLTPERTAVVRESFKYMLSVCDGAVMKDYQGFNHPDASIAHLLLSAGLETQEELLAAQFMLSRYSRQLSNKFPLLFEDKK